MFARKWYWGLAFILGAALMVVRGMGLLEGLQIEVWQIIAAAFFLPALIEGILNRQFFLIFIPLAFAAIILAVPLGITDHAPWYLMGAAVLLAIGCQLLFKSKGESSCNREFNGGTQEDLEGEVVCSRAFFGGGERYLRSPALKEVNLKCAFGGLEIYFDGAMLSAEGCQVNMDCSFGGVELYIPRSWKVKNNVSAIFGGVSVERNMTDENAPVLYLNGTVVFGGVDVKYI